jgi:hypothetical protein
MALGVSLVELRPDCDRLLGLADGLLDFAER